MSANLGRIDAAERGPSGFTPERALSLLGGLWFLTLAVVAAASLGASANTAWPVRLSSFLLALFYLMAALLIMTRPPAKAHAEGALPRILAFVGTYMPWTIGFFVKPEGTLPNFVASVLVVTGIVMTLVTLRHLGSAFSLTPQARHVVKTGPYRWIRHPLYLSEEIAFAGLVLQSLSPATVAVFLLHIGVQVCRIRYEENLLRRVCPEYAVDSARWRLIPYVW